MHPLVTRFAPLAALAAAGIGVAAWTALRTVAPQPVEAPAPPARHGPWAERVAASGLVEGDGEEIRVGAPEAGLVAEVAVAAGQRVARGDLLFRLDDRLLLAEAAVAESELATARAQLALAESRLARLAALPRGEDVAPAEARLGVAEARQADARIHRLRIEALWAKQGATASQVDAMRGAESIARAEAEAARAELRHAGLGAWERDRAVAEAEAAVCRGAIAAGAARLEAMRVRLARLRVAAPRDATVVDVGIAAGALAAPEDPRLVVLADLSALFVRAEVDDALAWRIRPDAPARGWLRGAGDRPIALACARIEPRAAARRASSGLPGERLDGRVMQVLYRLVDPPEGMRPGFLLDLDIAAGTR